ncbi:MAG TPA: hypothetical protein VLX92_32225 [Kofleriaceae bacterium]|nr:hypothetical protein [Kofleriaceae bacterium]
MPLIGSAERQTSGVKATRCVVAFFPIPHGKIPDPRDAADVIKRI